MQERRLGKGLRALLTPETVDVSGETETLPLDALRPNRLQPRGVMPEAGIRALAESIKEHGILQPIVVRRVGEGFEIVAGERRWRAARLAGLDHVPVRTMDVRDDGRALELALVENVQREDLDPISKAKALRRLVEVFGMTQDELAKRVGLDRATIANTVRLLDLPSTIQESVSRGTLSSGHARALLAFHDESVLMEIASRVEREALSVRQVEALAQAENPIRRAKGVRRMRKPSWTLDLEGRLRTRLGCRVSLVQRRGGWTIVLDCSSMEEVNRVTDVFLGTP